VQAPEPQPAGFAGEAEKGLRHGQSHQFGIADRKIKLNVGSPVCPMW